MSGRKRPVDVLIAALAARQFGVVARWQLAALGLTGDEIDYRLAIGRLHRVHQGVYAVGHPRISRDGRLQAAVLAFGEGAVLSHRTAAERWALLPPTSGLPHVTSAQRTFHGQPGIRLHRVRSLDPSLRVEINAIPVTTVPRTLLDLAAARDLHPLKRAWEEAQRLELLDVDAVTELCDNSPGRRVRPLRTLIADAVDAPDTRRELEDRFAELLRQHHDIPTPAFNVLVEGHLVDAVWLRQEVVVELDSKAYHSTDRAFERDRLRDNELQLAGYRVFRITWKRLAREPRAVADQVRRALGTSLPRGSSASRSGPAA